MEAVEVREEIVESHSVDNTETVENSETAEDNIIVEHNKKNYNDNDYKNNEYEIFICTPGLSEENVKYIHKIMCFCEKCI